MYQMQEFQERMFKIILCGSQGVGKTSIINRYIQGTFKEEYYSTIGIDFKLHLMTIGTTKVKLQLWDTAGQQRFQSLTSIHFKGAQAVICVIDISNKDSLRSCRHYLNQAINEFKICAENAFVIANKCDVECLREVSEEQISKLSKQFEVTVRSCSARNGEGINQVFEDLLARLVKQAHQCPPKPKEVILVKKQGKQSKCC